ncbi:phosphoglycolate phosphatase [Mucilaginibacter frigoritolerans]|jgi:phosphoglycolate phosphatase|uniref:phosphoglycolate phosphatase n=1 Tax=Mucilaginibacter frigoritolerans TaxID=652788 RepID=A0A562UFG3_9SPHI|nr:HAD family hydrolase [Mucilaginibacter frigoritolerans]TWJ04473.1 phosphoglycolate phosphatase [Mucilaginibacter frigoritolerans]
MSSLKNKFDSIIFDLDGTLWDSTNNVALAWQAAMDQVDYVDELMTRDRVRSITGLAYNVIFDRLFPNLDTEQRTELMGICAKSELEILHTKGGELYPALEETLDYLTSKYKLFIVSNCQNGYIEVFLKLSEMGHYFIGHQCYGTKGNPKSENIKDIVNDYQLTAPVYVGDTMGDFDAATKAGVPFIFANYGFGIVETGQVATISTFSELTELL